MPNDEHGSVAPQGGAGNADTSGTTAATPAATTVTPPSGPPYKKDPGMDALGELICRLNPYTRLPTNPTTGLSTGFMTIGMLPSAQPGYKGNDLNSTIACMGIEVERQYKPVWTFKGQEQTVQAAVRIPYRFPVYSDNGKQLLYWQTEYLLLGFVGGGGMG